MSTSDISATLGIDTSEFVAPILDAAKSVRNFSDIATESMENVSEKVSQSTQAIATSSHVYSNSSKATQETVVKAHSGIIASTLNWTGTMSIAASIVGLFEPKFKKYALGLALVSLSHKLYKSAVDASTASTRAMQRAIESASSPKSGSSKKSGSDESQNRSLASSALDVANVMGQRAVFATIAYKAGLDEVGDATARHLSLNSAMMKAISGVASSFSQAVTTGVDMFSEGIKGSLLAVIQFTTGFDSLTDIVDYGAGQITSFAQTVQKGMSWVAEGARDAGLAFGTALAIFQSGGTIDAAAFFEEGKALNEMAEATKRVTESQVAMKDALGIVNGAVKSADNGRKLALDQARISQIQTVAGIDAEIQKIREQTAATDKAITKTKEWRKYTADLVGLLEKQRTTIMTDEVKGKEEKPEQTNDAQKAFETATAGLNKLKYGQEAAERMAIQAMNATDEEVIALLALHDAAVKLKDEKFQADLFEKGQEKIEQMKDEIDKLSGAASNAEIEWRKLARAGYSQEQLDVMEDLLIKTDELNKKKKQGNQKDNKAGLLGSSESASIVLRGIGGSKSSTAEGIAKEQLAVARQQLVALKKKNSSGQIMLAGNINGY